MRLQQHSRSRKHTHILNPLRFSHLHPPHFPLTGPEHLHDTACELRDLSVRGSDELQRAYMKRVGKQARDFKGCNSLDALAEVHLPLK